MPGPIISIFTSSESYPTCYSIQYIENFYAIICAYFFFCVLSNVSPLIPQMIDDEEDRFCGVRLQTSPPVEPLTFGAQYIVSNSAHLEIIPTVGRIQI